MWRRLALLALMSGCSVNLQIPDDADISCTSDHDCPSGSVCDARQQCRSLSAAAKGVPGFDISPQALTIGESGLPQTVNIRLTAQPASPVTIVLVVDDDTEAFITPNILTFTTEDYGSAKAVTVTGARDCLADGPIASHIVIAPAQSADDDYSGLDPDDVDLVTNDDIPAAGITVTPATGLETSETGPVTQFSVAAACLPTADVHFTLATSDDTEGTVNVTDVIFTPQNWAVPRTITVAGRGDCAVDGDVAYSIVTSAVESDDPLYTGIDPPDVMLVNRDVAFSRLSVTPNAGLHTTESGSQATFSVVLTCAPSANVTVPLASSDTTEGSIGGVSSLVFTPANWRMAQAVIITGVNDNFDDGNIVYAITTGQMVSSDAGFSGLDPVDVEVTNDDDDTAGITIALKSGSAAHTTEAGGAVTYTITLSATPQSSVHIDLASSNTAEGTVAASVDFTGTSKDFSVTGVNDAVDDDNVSFTIVTGAIVSTDSAYNGMAVPDLAVTNDDDDTAGFSVGVPYVIVNEAGATAQMLISLSSKPLADVSCSTTDDFVPGEIRVGTSGTASNTFTPSGSGDGYNVVRYITITGLNDGVADGLKQPSIRTTCTSADPKYNNLATYLTAYNLEPASSRRVAVTTAPGYTGSQVAPASADTICGSGYKAVIASNASGHVRRACTTSNCTSTSENVDWALKPSTTYYYPDMSGIMGTTNSGGIFTSLIHGSPNGTGYVYNGGYWTGLTDTFTTAATCTDWTSSSSSNAGAIGLEHQLSVRDSFGWTNVPALCSEPRRLLCAEQ